MSYDFNDLTPLAPNHFLFRLGGTYFSEALNHQAINPRKRWLRIQQLLNNFYQALILAKNGSSHRETFRKETWYFLLNPKLNEEINNKCITETHPGADGQVRVAKVAVGKYEYLRPINRLCMPARVRRERTLNIELWDKYYVFGRGKIFMNNINLSYLFKFCRARALFEPVCQRARTFFKMMTTFQSYSSLVARTVLSSEERLCD